jgi:hypothetical protein
MRGQIPAAVIDAGFDEGRILRTHILRPTWHYVAATDLRWLMTLSGPRVDAGNSRRLAELGLDSRTIARATDIIAEAVDTGPRTRSELAQILTDRGISTAGQRIAYQLMHAELCRVVASGPMHGKRHTYAAFDQRVPAHPGPEGEEALATLARRYFSTRGPATLKDFVWWSGLPTAAARRALESVKPELEFRAVDEREYWFSPRHSASSRPRVDLVQCFDETIISYAETRDVLRTPTSNFPVPGHLEGFTHVLLLDGRLLGHWRRSSNRQETRIETRVDRGLRPAERTALDRAIGRYIRFLERLPP